MAGAFLKWAGGKTRYTSQLLACAPKSWERLVEPFMGSAALFFAAEPEDALLAELNEDLVICFQEVARDYKAVIQHLDDMPNTKRFFLKTRAADPDGLSLTERAARAIYLNKTCFRGLWRVNKKGQFNVPYGNYARPLYSADVMARASELLQRATIAYQPYADTLRQTKVGDWVYLDPPYMPAGGYSDFKRYTPMQFHLEDHSKLAEECRKLDERKVPFLLTNRNVQEARDLFRDFNLYELTTKRDIALDAKRRASSDLVVTNYSLPKDAPVMAIGVDGAPLWN